MFTLIIHGDYLQDGDTLIMDGEAMAILGDTQVTATDGVMEETIGGTLVIGDLAIGELVMAGHTITVTVTA